jgi:hypothetical protein
MKTRFTDEQIEKIEALDWRIYEPADGSIELEKHTPAGEDFTIYINPDDDILTTIDAVYSSYDPDEHAAELIPYRGQRGVPATIRAILEDAEALQKMLHDLTAALHE